MEKYDRIGVGYDSTRSADNHILECLSNLMGPAKKGLYLDVGCGTGNYTAGLYAKGYSIKGLDPSKEMIAMARKKYPMITWLIGKAGSPDMPPQSIQGIFATLTLHHWPYLDQAFRALGTILAPTGRIVIFTSTPQQMSGYWLNHYFPDMMQSSMEQMPSMAQIQKALSNTPLELKGISDYTIGPDLMDFFLYCGKQRPERYLNPRIRRGISSFADLAHSSEVERGLENLIKDISSGQINDIMKTYTNTYGDYKFLVLEKMGTT